MNQSYFEAGKVTSNAMRDFVFSSFITILFLVSHSPNELTVPIINLNMAHETAVSVMLLIDSFMFYRFMAAVNYERELKNWVQNECEGSIEKTWLQAYPSLWNFTQFQRKVMHISRVSVVITIAVVLLFMFAFVIPLWALIQAIVFPYGWKSIIVILFSFAMFVWTIFGLFRTSPKK